MQRTHQLSHMREYRCASRCCAGSINMTKLLVSWYNRSGVSNLLGLDPWQPGAGPHCLGPWVPYTYEFVLQFLEGYANEVIESSAVSALIVPSISSEHQKQQESQESNALKIARKAKFNAVKNAKRVKSKALKAEQIAKPTPTFQDIDIFDPTLTCEDRRFSESKDFLQHLQQCQHQYRESDLLTLLLACLWDSAFDIWFDKQTTMKSASLDEWIETLRVDFANAPFAKVKTANITCMRCDSSFNSKEKLREHVRKQHAKKPANSSSLSVNTAKSICETEERSAVIEASTLQAEVEKVIDQPVEDSPLSINAVNFVCEIEETTESVQRTTICQRCNQTFDFNNKLHEHIREHHARKPVRSLNLRALTPGLTCKTIEKPAGTRPPASLTLQKPPTPLATPRSQIFSAEIASRSVSSSGSNLSIATHKTTPKPVETASINGFFTPPATPSSMLRKSASKPHLTIDDLFRMFRGNSRPFGLRQHHNRRPFSRGFGLRQPGRPCSTSSRRPHLTIKNLFEMFDGRSRRKGLFQGQNNVSSQAFSGQMQIIVYFKPTVNQKPSINQALKSSNPKSLNQHMPAESIRTASSEILPEKSAKLSYKLPDVFCINFKPQIEAPFFISILFRFFPAFLLAFAFVSAMSAARMGCISVYQQVISVIGRANIELVASRRSWEETRDRMFEYSVTKHLHKRCFAYTFYWMDRTHRLSHAFKYRCVNRCYTGSANTVKLLVSWYNRSKVFKDSQGCWRVVCLLMAAGATRKRLYGLVIFQKVHYTHALLDAMYTPTLAYA